MYPNEGFLRTFKERSRRNSRVRAATLVPSGVWPMSKTKHEITIIWPQHASEAFDTYPVEHFEGVSTYDIDEGILSFKYQGKYRSFSGIPFAITSWTVVDGEDAK